MPGEEEQHNSPGLALSSGARESIAPGRLCTAARQNMLWSSVALGSQTALLMVYCIWQHSQYRKEDMTLQVPG